jgi:alkylated DNA nucleotide flippase Atl1
MEKKQSLFSKTVCDLALRIPAGKVVTYAMLAHAAGGGTQAARSITAILGKSLRVKDIPFHRIVYAQGRVWFSPEHEKKRRKLYRDEGIEVDEQGRILNFKEVLWSMDHEVNNS